MKSIRDLAREFDLSVDELAMVKRFDALFLETAAHTNLVARSTIEDRWERHWADSLQLWPLIPSEAATLLDIGSGGGFPGIPLAILAQHRRLVTSPLTITLSDKVGKKASFLRSAAASLGLGNVSVHSGRVEVFHVKQQRFDVVTARAVTALPKLLELAQPLATKEGMCIFSKGETWQEELTDAAAQWTYSVEDYPSISHDQARLLCFRDLRRKGPPS